MTMDSGPRPGGTPDDGYTVRTYLRGNTMAETYNGYCVKCKEKRDFEGEAVETNGRRMAKGICPVCGTKMNRILGKEKAE